MEIKEVYDDKPPPKDILHRFTGFVSAHHNAMGQVLRQWANDGSLDDVCFIRSIGYLGRIPIF